MDFKLSPALKEVLPIYHLDSFYYQQLYQNLSVFPSAYLDFEDFLYECISNLALFPPQLIKLIIRLKTEPQFPGALLIKNLPIDSDLPTTPAMGTRSVDKKTFISEGILISIGQLLGVIFSYRQEKEGELIHNVCPVKERQHERSNAGATQDFLLHTELAYFEHRPDFLILFCLKPHFTNDIGFTTLAFAKPAIQKLSAKDVQLLRQPVYKIGIPESFTEINSQCFAKVLSGTLDNPQICVNFNSMESITKEGTQALQRLRSYLEAMTLNIFLNKGDMLIIDNRKSVHGRTPFKPNFDGNDRWLQRIYIKSDLWAASHLLKSSHRVLEYA